jgi:heme-degrading monooxygenase HmoA
MIKISKGNEVATLINVYQTTPENQDHLVAMIIKSTEEVASKQNGYISAAVHKSIDGTRVTNYSQWTTPETLQAMLHIPEFKASFKDVMLYATSFEPHTYFIEYAHDISPK